jgi:hypothetical protein
MAENKLTSTTIDAPKSAKLPTAIGLSAAIKYAKNCIDDDSRIDDEDRLPGIQLTIGWSDTTGEWSYQTGDNSYTGGAYHYPHWVVVDVYRRSSSKELVKYIQGQLQELTAWKQ